MYSECRRILPSGRKCKSPALKGQDCCYFHDRFDRHRDFALRVKDEPFQLPPIEDARGIQIGLAQVLTALGSGRINIKEASTFLYGLQLAMQLLKHAAPPAPIETIRELAHIDGTGRYIAPEQTHCDPQVDCTDCAAKDTCLNADRLNMRSVQQVLRAIRQGQQGWEEKLDKAENPRPPEIPSYLTSQLERAKEAEASGEFYNGRSSLELQDEIQFFLERHAPEKDPFGLRSLVEPDHLYNLKRALQPRTRAEWSPPSDTRAQSVRIRVPTPIEASCYELEARS